ncbi:MAG: GrpB family protein [Clostridiales bacterium]|nr:GrpB family protein [Clostridiales bacterium]
MTTEELWFLFPIELKEHNPLWAEWYEEERSNLIECLGDMAIEIDHIGSTAVKGLTAKPIVDILLQVSESCDKRRLKSTLSDNGWILMYDDISQGIHLGWNKGYTINGFADRIYHLHVRSVGDWEELHFRDYLRSSQKAVKEYESIKRELALRYRNNRDAYTEAKGDFIRACVREERESHEV